jgi:hypothetical protein
LSTTATCSHNKNKTRPEETRPLPSAAISNETKLTAFECSGGTQAASDTAGVDAGGSTHGTITGPALSTAGTVGIPQKLAQVHLILAKQLPKNLTLE